MAKFDERIKPYKAKNGSTKYMFQVYLGIDPLTGRSKSATRRGFATIKEAQKELENVLGSKEKLLSGESGELENPTFEELSILWFELAYANTVEQSTLLKTEGLFKNHILPYFGKMKVANVNTIVCQRFVNQLADKLVGFDKVKSYASLVFKFALVNGYIEKNPFDNVTLPKKKKNLSKFDNFYEKETLVQFLKAFEKEGNFKNYAIIHLLAYTGMRKGELFALHWNDIVFEDNLIIVRRSIKRSKKGIYLSNDTKTRKSRLIPVEAITLEILKEWQEKQQTTLQNEGQKHKGYNQLVFQNTKNNITDPNRTYSILNKVIDKYNFPRITAHGLRHTHCSLLFEAGVSLKEVQERLGHEDSKTTLDIYTHVSRKGSYNAIQQFTDFLNESDESNELDE